MTEKWQSTDLSTILPELSDSAWRLKGSLEEGQINVEQCIAILESMERSIDDLKSTFSISDERPSGKGAPNLSLDPKILGKEARDTLWNALPVFAIANAHEEKAKSLTQGGADLREIYIEHSKYFLLHKLHNANYENDPVVTEVFGKVILATESLLAKHRKIGWASRSAPHQGDINSHGSSLGWVPAENGKMRPEEIAVHTIEF
ncbi:hypothetical protein B0H16DRAFT_1461749 [Mycena metata]|uniref:Uncharacterized protein n=1 Tax=Mycena metata TaxID=1033252 RepID=A0AAD7IPZ3_9AGAR|nr:hypothetical protein B0H16DRAFT_1461749 [Mycena metata]